MADRRCRAVRTTCSTSSSSRQAIESQSLFGGGHSGEMEALYYSRLVPAKYYLDVLGLYLLNLLVANSPLTVNDREKISADALRAITRWRIGHRCPRTWTNRPSRQESSTGSWELFQDGKNELREVFSLSLARLPQADVARQHQLLLRRRQRPTARTSSTRRSSCSTS